MVDNNHPVSSANSLSRDEWTTVEEWLRALDPSADPINSGKAPAVALVETLTTRAEVREVAFYFGNLQHQRLNIFLLAETILGAVVAMNAKSDALGLAIVSVFGLIVTGLLWRTLRRLEQTNARADTLLRYLDPIYGWLHSGRPDDRLSTAKVHRFWLPLSFAIGWSGTLFWAITSLFS